MEFHYICNMKFFEKYTPGNRKINPSFFWDYDIQNTDLTKSKRLVATRIIKMGRLEDFYAAFDQFGGIRAFAKIAKNEVTGLSNKELNFICQAFGFKKETTQCYKNAQLRERHLNF